MKNIIIILLSVMALTACDSIIDVKPTSSLTYNGFWDNEEKAKAAHIGLYSTMRGYAYTFWALGELRSDIWGGSTIESPFSENFIQQKFNSSSVPFKKWGNLYVNIHRLNDFIKNVPDVKFRKEADRNHMLGQAYGMRAFIYYTLLRTWGEVPITVEPQVTIDASNVSKERSPKSDVMALIKSDIAKSLEYFGEDNSFWKNKRVYWSKAATLVLKGDVYIWSGNHMDGGNSDYQEAVDALNKVGSSSIKLLDNYADIFKYNNKNNNEIIFSFDYDLNEESNFYNSFNGRSTEINVLFNEEGESLSKLIVNGANRYGPSKKVLDFTNDDKDSRKKATFLRMYSDNSGDESKYTASILVKFFGILESGSRKAVDNVPVYRYSDALLLLAEAKNNLGQDPSDEINMVRKRAYGGNYTDDLAYSNGSKEDNTKEILNERLKEFIGEGKRWWDLRRAGNKWVFENNEYLYEDNKYKLVLPISEDMIGRNPKLTQTEGY